jgi:hypothetical protein
MAGIEHLVSHGAADKAGRTQEKNPRHVVRMLNGILGDQWSVRP